MKNRPVRLFVLLHTIVICLVTLLIFLNTANATEQARKKIRVTFLNPQAQEKTWWPLFERIMQAACDDLGMDLTVYRSHLTRGTMIRQARKALANPDSIDVMVFKNFKKSGAHILNLCEKAKVHAFMINAGLSAEEQVKYGKPREKFKYWLGQLILDDERAGYDLGAYLLDEAKLRKIVDSDGKVAAMAISGIAGDAPAIQRNKGFMRAIKERSFGKFLQQIPGDWSFERTYKKFPFMLGRYPVINVCWAANDPMALGAIKAIKEAKKKPGGEIIIGGIDWTRDGIKAVSNGDMAITVGGHFIDSAWAMVLLYDYFNGIDFKSEGFDLSSRMSSLTNNNINMYLKHFGDQNWENIDFKKFSKRLNPEIEEYNFSLDAIMKQFEE